MIAEMGPGGGPPLPGRFVAEGRFEEDPLKGTLLNPTSGSLRSGLIERAYVPKIPPHIGLSRRL